MKPEFVDGIFIHLSSPRVLYLNPEAPDWITINEKYKPILDLFDGKNDEAVIYEYIKKHYYDEYEILLTQIKSMLENINIFKHNQNNYYSNANDYCKPKYIYITLTDSCNLKCSYCYATERKIQGDTSYEIWRNYISDIIDFSCKPVFTFTGGEPLTVPYVFDLASCIKEHGCECILLTNGTLIDNNEKAQKISQLFDFVKISLDSINKDISDELRGEGVLEKVINAHKLLLQNNCNVQIMATVTQKTMETVDDFSEYFNNNVNFQPLYNIGRSKTTNNLEISGKQYYDALTKKGKFKHLHGYANKILNFKNKPYKRCSYAKEELSIDSNGNVFPCHMMHYDNLLCGNLKNEKIKDIYEKSLVLNKLRKINVDTLPECKICVYRNFCGGGCRARNDISKQGIEGWNEFCEFEQMEILDALLYSYE
jgi:radical SAM protein with 4Fe4S-binding SPASM domain